MKREVLVNLFKVLAVCVLVMWSAGFSASVKIGNLVWSSEDAEGGRLFSEIDLTNACPVGWHVARIEDWANLFRAIGASQECRSYGYEGADDSCDYNIWKNAGLLLKSKSFKGMDKYGFSVYPNGDAFGQKGYQATYWALGGSDNWVCFLEDDDALDYCGQDSNWKFLVRCVKD